jgi:hypothetical protein
MERQMNMTSTIDELIKEHARRLEQQSAPEPLRLQRLKTALRAPERVRRQRQPLWRTALASLLLLIVMTLAHLAWLGCALPAPPADRGSDPLLNGLAPQTVASVFYEVMPWVE